MIQLLTKYQVTDILIFICILAIAFKSVISFMDWFNERLKISFNRSNKPKEDIKNIEQRICKIENQIQELKKDKEDNQKQLEKLKSGIKLLIDSDRDSIKSYITKEHHFFCYQQKWIDDYSLDCIEKRYCHYKEEEGNSFVEELMKDLRELPNIPPK